MIYKFNSKLEYQIKIGKLSITRFAGFLFIVCSNLTRFIFNHWYGICMEKLGLVLATSK